MGVGHGERFELPMFPLGRVLFPGAVLPLHVFEPRYRDLVHHCLGGDPRFGVVLIERGREVGGGDTRFSTGTIARIVQAAKLPDGRFALVTVGTARVQVIEWLPDDPYPRAIVGPRAEAPAARPPDELIGRVWGALTRVHALRAELGLAAAPIDGPSGDDVTAISYEAAVRAPIGPLDAQELLELDDPVERLERLAVVLEQEAEILRFRLSG